jgi:thiol-disulfide isomerase/thioredoxin
MKALVLFVFILFAHPLVAGTVNLLPMQFTEGGELTIEYKASDADKAWIDRVKSITAVVFTFDATNDLPTAHDVPLKFDGKRYAAEFAVPTGTVFGLVKVGDGLQFDTNKDRMWEFLVHDASGRPLRNAHMKCGLSYLGGLPAECRRKDDQNEALAHMEKETMLYTSNVTAQVNVVLLQASLQMIGPEEVSARLREVVGSKTVAADPNEAIALAQAYRTMQQPDEANKIMQTAAMRWPGSKAAEQIELERLSTAPNLDGFVAMVIRHLDKYPTTFARQNLIDYVIDATTNGRQLGTLVHFITNVEGLTAINYYKAVNYIGATDSLKTAAAEMITRGLQAADNDALKPTSTSTLEWKEQQRISKSLLSFVKGAIAQSQGEVDAAITSFDQAMSLGGEQTDQNVYAMYIQALRTKSKKDKALEIATLALRRGSNNQAVVDAYRELRAEKGASESSVAADLAKLQKEGNAMMVERLSREMLNQNRVEGTFTTLDGKPVNMSDWKGKVVILDYWATWCGPCRKSFPSMQKLYEQYKNHPNVQFAIVNVWERVDDRTKHVQDFLKENPTLTFPVFIDKDDAVVQQFGVTGIPTKFYLGKDGRIQFKEVGYLPEEQFIKEATEKIEVLLAQ